MKLKIIKVIVASLIYIGSAPSLSATTLEEAIDATMKTNPDVLAVSNERNAVAEEVKQVRAGYFPTIDLAIGTGHESIVGK